MNIFKRNKQKVHIDEIIKFVDEHHNVLAKKCRDAYDSGDNMHGRWWDCQACAMLTLMDKLKKEFKEN